MRTTTMIRIAQKLFKVGLVRYDELSLWTVIFLVWVFRYNYDIRRKKELYGVELVITMD